MTGPGGQPPPTDQPAAGEPLDDEAGYVPGLDERLDHGVDALLGEPVPVAARRAAGQRGHRRRRRPLGLLLAVLTLAALLVLVLVGGAFVVRNVFGGSGAADYAGRGDGTPARVQVHAGDSAGAIAETLQQEAVVKSAGAFSAAAAADERSRTIQPGFYQLQHRMSAASALQALLDPKTRLRTRVTIPEGSTLQRTLDLVAAGTDVARVDLQAAVANPAALGLPPYAKGRLEGYLFPATYDIAPGTSAVKVLTMMTRRFAVAADSVQLEARAKALGRTPDQVVIVASLIEREAAQAADRPQVARVVYNRLKEGIKLGFESTLRFALGNATDTRLKQSQIDSPQARSSPYNTFVVAGLPPGPIDSPGQASLEAALAPAAGDILYFVTLPKTNKTVFVNTEAEFNGLVAQCRAEGGC